MKQIALLVTLVSAVFIAPATVHARGVVHTSVRAQSVATKPHIACPSLQIFQQPVNFYHETMYATLYEEQTGSPCAPDGFYFVQGQIDFSGSQTHSGTFYAELMAGPPYLPIESATVTYSPTTNIATTPATTVHGGCGLKGFVLFDGNGFGFLTTDFRAFC